MSDETGVDESREQAPERPLIDAELVRRLIAGQFPHWAGLPVAPVEFGGVDNRTFHLGDGMTVRLPSAEGYAPQVDKEQRWLPVLAPQLPLPVPVPLAKGLPAEGYPFGWSVIRWIEGETAAGRTHRRHDRVRHGAWRASSPLCRRPTRRAVRSPARTAPSAAPRWRRTTRRPGVRSTCWAAASPATR